MKVLSKGEYFDALEIIGNYNRITGAIPKEKTHLLAIPIFWVKYLYGSNYLVLLDFNVYIRYTPGYVEGYCIQYWMQ